MGDGLPPLEWIKPHHIEAIKSIILNKESSAMFFENRRFQKIVIGKQNVLLQQSYIIQIQPVINTCTYIPK